MEQEMTLDIMEIFQIIKKRIKFIVSITIISGVISGLVSFYLLKPVYQANVSIIVGLTNTSQIDPNQSNLYEKVLNTYSKIALSKDVAQEAANKLKDGTSAAELLASTTVTQQANTQILVMAVNNGNPGKAYNNIQAMSAAFIEQSEQLFTSGKAQIMDKATVPTSPMKPDKKKNIALAMLIGLMVSVGIAFLLEYMDRTIKSERDIEKYVGLPIVGVIQRYSLDKEV